MTVLGGLNVSRETLKRLEAYAGALKKWNPKINLVAKSTIDALWDRHFLDSSQVFEISPERATTWADLGAGGGFPGLVVAILAAEERPQLSVILVESDQRKAAFLRNVIRETGISAPVVPKRIEDTPALGADIISARALADLSTLLALSEDHLAPDGVMLFPKGKNWQSELAEAQSKWRFDYEVARSKTSDQSVILKISGARRA